MNELGKKRDFGKPFVKRRIPGGGRYKSPSGETHRGRLMAHVTDCGAKISEKWEEIPANSPITCSKCKNG